jgi:hypothetical protein
MGKFAELLRKESQADDQAEVSRLVGADKPPKKGFGDHVAVGERSSVAKQEDKARDWCLTHPEVVARQGAPGELYLEDKKMQENRSFVDEQRRIDESKRRVIQALRLAATAISDASDGLHAVWWQDLSDPNGEIQAYREQAWVTVSGLLAHFSKTVEGLSTADLILDNLFDGFRRKCEDELQTLALRNNLRISLILRAEFDDEYRRACAHSTTAPSVTD